MLCLSPGKGGLELYAQRSTQIIEQLGYHCDTVCNPQSSVFTNKTETINNKVYTLKTSFHLLPLFSAYQLARIIDSNEIDIMTIHWSRDFNIAVFAKLLSSRNVKLIYTRHMAITRYKNDFYHNFLYRNIDCFVVITKQLMKEAIQFLPLPESKIKLLYHAVNKPESNSSSINCDKFKITSTNTDYLHVAIFSRIEQGKGQHLLVEAVKALKSKNKEIHVTIIGHVMDEQYNTNLKKSIHEYQLDNQFHFYQFIDQASLYMRCFDVVALTTTAETFGLVLIEAMQSGVAVIGSNAGGVPEIIDDTVSGLLFESGNAQALADKIELLYDDSDFRVSLAQKGKNSVLELFSEQQH
ncbi:MAG: glycosyltransferase family 4 protein, partial [Thiohalomonadales bacterium]